jgi:hypothetical protein
VIDASSRYNERKWISFLPLYQVMHPDEKVFSEPALSRAREHLVRFIVAGMMIDLPQTTEERGEL